MPNWNQVHSELQSNSQGPHDRLRLKYLKALHKHTGRNILSYYSGFLQKPGFEVEFGITDADKTGFMTCSHQVDRSKGLDLILHTPGGDLAATESIIDYLHSLYDGNIRAIVPQLAMSAGTLMALSCKSIVMGRQSSLGPVDPQIAGMPAQGIVEEFERIQQDVSANPNMMAVWQPILQRWWPTLLTSSIHVIDWADQLLRDYLANCMFADLDEGARKERIEGIADHFGKQKNSKAHNRHISHAKAAELGIEVVNLEGDQKLQDCVITLHHALTHTFMQTGAVKIIENHKGVAYINQIQFMRN